MTLISIDFGSTEIKLWSKEYDYQFTNRVIEISDADKEKYLEQGCGVYKLGDKTWAVGVGEGDKNREVQTSLLSDMEKLLVALYHSITKVIGKITTSEQRSAEIAIAVCIPDKFLKDERSRLISSIAKQHKFSLYSKNAAGKVAAWHYDFTIDKENVFLVPTPKAIYECIKSDSIQSDGRYIILDCGYEKVNAGLYSSGQQEGNSFDMLYAARQINELVKHDLYDDWSPVDDGVPDEQSAFNKRKGQAYNSIIEELSQKYNGFENISGIILAGGFAENWIDQMVDDFKQSHPNVTVIAACKKPALAQVKGSFRYKSAELSRRKEQFHKDKPQQSESRKEELQQAELQQERPQNNAVKEPAPVDMPKKQRATKLPRDYRASMHIKISLHYYRDMDILTMLDTGLTFSQWANNCIRAYLDGEKYTVEYDADKIKKKAHRSRIIMLTLKTQEIIDHVAKKGRNKAAYIKVRLKESIKGLPQSFFDVDLPTGTLENKQKEEGN